MQRYFVNIIGDFVNIIGEQNLMLSEKAAKSQDTECAGGIGHQLEAI